VRINALDLNAMDHCLDENDERSNCDPIDSLLEGMTARRILQPRAKPSAALR
jgi:hypothetical protein